MSILDDIGKYIPKPPTRKGVAVICFIACGLLIISLVDYDKSTPWIPLVGKVAIWIFSISTFVSLGVRDFARPYVTATVKSFKYLKCENYMETSELQCQNCGSTFRMKL